MAGGAWVDGATALSKANLDEVTMGDTGAGYMVCTYRIYYTGAAWSIVASHGSIVSDSEISVAWSGANDRLEIDLSGATRHFSDNKPTSVVSGSYSSHATVPNYYPQALAIGNQTVYVKFYDITDSGNIETVEDAKMDINLVLHGTYSQ